MPRLRYALAYAFPLLHLVAVELRGPWVWIAPLYAFGVVPLLDVILRPGDAAAEDARVEHVLGHHRRAATFEDPATARRGEWVYAFIARSCATGLVHAWQLESRRTAKRGIAWTLRDRRLRHALVQGALVGAVLFAFGPLGLALFLAQAAVAVCLLELVDYIEHYGLVRRRLVSGRHERVQPRHSWNSAHPASSAHLFQLTRHSDHHAEASRPYHRLRVLSGEAPVMPAGYPAMILLSLAPPLFFRVVDPLIDALESCDAAA